MILDLSNEEARALLNVLIEIIEADRYPSSPRIRLLREILDKFGEIAPEKRHEGAFLLVVVEAAGVGALRRVRGDRRRRQ